MKNSGMLLMILAELLLSGCVTTSNMLEHSEDRVSPHPDYLLGVEYAYNKGDHVVTCVNAERREETAFSSGIPRISIRYEFDLPITELNDSSLRAPSLSKAGVYRISQTNIRDCRSDFTQDNPEIIDAVRLHDTELRDYMSEHGSPGDLLFIGGSRLVYVTEDMSLIRIRPAERIEEGKPALYLLAPFTLAYDVVLLPFRAAVLLVLMVGQRH